MTCRDDRGHVFPEGAIVCANGKRRWECHQGEWISLGVPCEPGDPPAVFDPETPEPPVKRPRI